MKSNPTPTQKRTAKGRPGQGTARAGSGPLAPGAGTTLKGVDLPLPHERDESTHSVSPTPDPVMVQAHRDIEAGLVDTDMRATPGLDAQRRADLVPGAGGKPPGKARR